MFVATLDHGHQAREVLVLLALILHDASLAAAAAEELAHHSAVSHLLDASFSRALAGVRACFKPSGHMLQNMCVHASKRHDQAHTVKSAKVGKVTLHASNAPPPLRTSEHLRARALVAFDMGACIQQNIHLNVQTVTAGGTRTTDRLYSRISSSLAGRSITMMV
jgi:hypothetical protein